MAALTNAGWSRPLALLASFFLFAGIAFPLTPVLAQDNLTSTTPAVSDSSATSSSTDSSSTSSSSTGSSAAAAPVAQALSSSTDIASGGQADPKLPIGNSNGDFRYSVDIAVPAFHGLEPSLTLNYSSNLSDDFPGVGWKLLGVSQIERATAHWGAPGFTSADIFLLDRSEMVACVAGMTTPSCTTGGNFATRIESYLRIKQNTSPNTWTVTGRDGTVLTYSPLSTWTTYNSGDPNQVNLATNYRWMLSSAVDTHGNTVTYSYACDGLPNCYIDTISYNGSVIKFYKELRTDKVTYATGAGLGSMQYRLKTINLTVGGSHLRAYALTYNTGTGTGRSVLASVQEFGKDSSVAADGTVSGGTSLPATTFTYTSIGAPWVTHTNWPGTGTTTNGSRWIAGDFNGDGRTEWAGLTGGCQAEIRRSNGTSLSVSTWNISGCSGAVGGEGYLAADVNGDGKDDIVIYTTGTGGTHAFTATVLLSTGSGFTKQSWATNLGSWAVNSNTPGSPAPGFFIGDFNGDGLSDVGMTRAAFLGGSSCQFLVFLSTGSAFQLNQWTVSNSDACPTWSGSGSQIFAFEPLDVDGDGKTDLLETRALGNMRLLHSTGSGFAYSTPSVPTGGTLYPIWLRGDVDGDGRTDLIGIAKSGSQIQITPYLSTGLAFTAGTTASVSGSDPSGGEFVVGDFNGDGRADVAGRWTDSTGTVGITFTSTGNSFVQQTQMPFSWTPPGNDPSHNPVAADFDGNGLADVSYLTFNKHTDAHGNVTYDGFQPDQLQTPNGTVPDLLTQVHESLGGTTTITYKPSSQWTNTNLPFIVQTAASLVTNDGRGNQATITGTYTGGLWNAVERRFLGFATLTATLPCDAGETQCPTNKSTFLQSLAAYGPVTQVEQRVGAGNLLHQMNEEYTVNTSTLPYTALNTASQETVVDGGTTRIARKTRTFDAYGNVTLLTELGDTSATGDEITTAVTYEPNPSAYLVKFPALIQKYAGTMATGTPLKQQYLIYDNAGAYTTPPTKGDVTTQQDWLDQTSSLLNTTFEYDAFGNQTASLDPLGDRSEAVFDSTYHLFAIETHDPLYFTDPRHKATATWDTVCGLQATGHDLNSQLTSYTYDNLCRPTRTDLPDGGFKITSYVNIGTPTTQYIEVDTPPADGTGNIWTKSYMDGFSRTYSTHSKGPAANQDIVVDTAYSPRSEIATTTAPYYVGGAIQTSTFIYDGISRPTKLVLPDTNFLTKSYGIGTAFQKSTVSDELGRPVTKQFDAYGRVVRLDKLLSGATVSTSYTYDVLGRLTGIHDNAGNAWSYTYDSLDRKIAATDPDLGSWTYGYDNASRLTLQTDALGQQTQFVYDAMSRLLTKTISLGTPQVATTTYTYDEARSGAFNVGRQTTASNAAGVCQYNYDSMGRLTAKTWIVDGVTYPETMGYDTGGRQIWMQYPTGDQIGSPATPWTYDSAGRLLAIPGLITSTVYNARNEVTQQTRSNGVVTNTTYSVSRGWVLGIQTQNASVTTLQNLTLTRDGRGRVLTSTSDVSAESWTYSYDDMDRLLTATNTGNSALTQSFTFDAVDNILTNSGVGTYTYPLPGTARPHAVTAAGGTSYGYDANGNMISAGGVTLTYDGQNRLVSDGSAASFVYGPDGSRLKKVTLSGTTLYLGDDIEVTGGVTTLYLPGDAIRIAGVTSWNHRDQLNSVRLSTDATGAVVQRAHYKPFGERLETTSTLLTAKGYIGERNDTEIGLIYLHARYYNPVLAKFVSADPSSPAVAGVGVNRYAYVSNSPIANLDPTGLIQGGGNDHYGGVGAPHGTNGGDPANSGAGGTDPAHTAPAPNHPVDKDHPAEDVAITAVSPLDVTLDATILGYYGCDEYCGGLPSPQLVFNGPTPITNPPGYNTSDFAAHYLFGDGSPIDLKDVGLSGLFENAPEVRAVTGEFINDVMIDGFPGYTTTRPGYTNVKNVGIMDPILHEPSLFSVGGSTIYMSASCGSGGCDLSFRLVDSFTQPLTGFNYNGEVPTAHPYGIFDAWHAFRSYGARWFQ